MLKPPSMRSLDIVVEVPTVNKGFFYCLGPVLGLELKTQLVIMDEMARGKGIGHDAPYPYGTTDGKYKLYQDRFDILCLCSISFRQAMVLAAAHAHIGGHALAKRKGSYEGNLALNPRRYCPDRPPRPLDELYQPVLKFNECIDVPGLNDWSCATSGSVEDAKSCVPSTDNPLSRFFSCPMRSIVSVS